MKKLTFILLLCTTNLFGQHANKLKGTWEGKINAGVAGIKTALQKVNPLDSR